MNNTENIKSKYDTYRHKHELVAIHQIMGDCFHTQLINKIDKWGFINRLYLSAYLTEDEMRSVLYSLKNHDMKIPKDIIALKGIELICAMMTCLHTFINENHTLLPIRNK